MLLALALPAVGLGELAAGIWQRGRAPTDDEWTRLEALVAAEHRPGDVVVVAPRWAEPHARRALGDRYFPPAMLARPDDSRPDRALVLVSTGHTLAEAGLDPRFFPLPKGDDPGARLRPLTAHLSLAVLPNAHPGTVLGDLLAHVTPDELRVSRRHDERDYPCTYTEQAPAVAGGLFAPPALPRGRWLCLEDAHERAPFLQGVGLTIQDDASFLPRRCLAVPIGGGAGRTTILETNAAPLGPFLTGHGGVYWTRQRERTGAEVVLDIFLDGRPRGQVVFAEGTGFQPFEVSLGAPEGTTGTLRFELHTRDGSARPFCLEAVTRRAGWEGLGP
jgi:hypothetical protein